MNKLENLNSDELYNKLVCALLCAPKICSNCLKCGDSTAECRMNLITELAKYMNKDFPWGEPF